MEAIQPRLPLSPPPPDLAHHQEWNAADRTTHCATICSMLSPHTHSHKRHTINKYKKMWVSSQSHLVHTPPITGTYREHYLILSSWGDGGRGGGGQKLPSMCPAKAHSPK